jgi:hypothetical protein
VPGALAPTTRSLPEPTTVSPSSSTRTGVARCPLSEGRRSVSREYDRGDRTVLLSDAINRHPKIQQQSLTITERLVVLACDSCGESMTCADAEVVREEAVIVYRCPKDGATLATVEGGEKASTGDDSFRAERLAIRLGGEEIQWSDLLLSLDELDD